MTKVELSAADVVGLTDLWTLVEKTSLDLTQVSHLYEKAGHVLASNVERLRLDPDTFHICAFARCVAGELMTPAARSIHFPSGCWRANPRSNFPPFYRKDERGAGLSIWDIKTPQKQRAAMLNTLAQILRNDPSRRPLADLMLAYEKDHLLWTAADEIDIDE